MFLFSRLGLIVNGYENKVSTLISFGTDILAA